MFGTVNIRKSKILNNKTGHNFTLSGNFLSLSPQERKELVQMDQIVILLYYKYTRIENPQDFAKAHLEFCKNLGLNGRIIVAGEGINGTVAGTAEQTEAYKAHLLGDTRFSGIEFKTEYWDKNPFKKMHCRAKDEIVHLGAPDLNPNELTGTYLEPQEFLEMMENDPDVVILDTRNNYESEIGRFKNAITPDIDNFRDFPEYVKSIENLKDKKILAYCTGGIRCEKATGVLLKAGFKHVYQLHGGIITYGQKTGGKNWEGKCYVFDGRISVPVNQFENTVISTCRYCKNPSDRYINCTNAACNKQIIVCETCEPEHNGACSDDCAKHPMARWKHQEF